MAEAERLEDGTPGGVLKGRVRKIKASLPFPTSLWQEILIVRRKSYWYTIK